MPVNKVVFGAVSIMDISDSTVTPETLAEGATAYDKTGAKITGTMKASEDLDAELTEQASLISELSTVLDGKAAGGSGGGVCTLEIIADVPVLGATIYWIDGNGELQKNQYSSMDIMTGISLQCLKGSPVCADAHFFVDMGNKSYGGVKQMNEFCIFVTDDATFVIS